MTSLCVSLLELSDSFYMLHVVHNQEKVRHAEVSVLVNIDSFKVVKIRRMFAEDPTDKKYPVRYPTFAAIVEVCRL